jgi:putative FmdB family regulatory protein
MPTYEYKCNACDHAFELFHSMKDAPKRECPACGKNALERLIGSGAAIIFKGSGFYETDYRTESYRKSAEAEKGAASPDSASHATSDSKPDTTHGSKADSKPEAQPAARSEAKPGAKPQPASQAKPEPGAKKESRSAKGIKPKTPASKHP